MKLSTFIPAATGLAAGYVLGAAAGRGRYRQITSAASRVANHPKVQQTVFDLAGQAKSNAHRAPGPVAGLINTAATRVQDNLTEPAAGADASGAGSVEPTVESTPQPGPTL